ncbi:EF-hand calcium-binding domain-containing protein 11 isoform X5 [Mustela lutreola]|uniref:EF-hand calcium-binding domain-containing protein 11 isoform X5 n=1 Tax=Mustela lutreola TaxID=9666 RepID=UPI002797332F|nr:EF-hand calcium-binding domain-containing protein 11 isoform X5 [Mustela lutreola]
MMVAMFFSEARARPWTWEASPSEHKKWVEVFKACDEDNKGYLSREDFKVAVIMLFGYKPSKIEADFAMSSVNPNASDRGYLTLEDFKTAFKQVAPKLSERTVLDVFSRQFPVRIHFPFGKSLSDPRFFGHNSSFTSLSLPTVINP